ncbi:MULTISPECIES: DNA alkylation repair protein [Bacillales]|uniref:DNA alkylation repair protein n=1 Tax=Bacillales TaxID=1385 RepID=UPI00188438C3|nr:MULTISPECIES: DNA alkylation repair protein [Bacillaceae]MBF0708958.1 DNA alkylation repair protein [Pseudalkalibacillus hwajinpoensis]MDO6655429.1 DNA alkylation repair protein [Anaerobacillus sp. 1_MG-2023]WLR60236.1 DNA alkylation repair protein [Pseudalkalibacillus hwajinpoensis]
MTAYLCPRCKTNRMRFNKIEQKATSVKLDPQSGEVMSIIEEGKADPFHMVYKGPSIRVQCGACGEIGDEETFIQFARSHPRANS